MQLRLLTASILALPFLAAATPTALEARQSTSSCNTGSISCCQQVQTAQEASENILLSLLGVIIGDLTGEVGINCSPISVVGVGSGDACNASPVCCSNTQVGGLIGVGCVPITL